MPTLRIEKSLRLRNADLLTGRPHGSGSSAPKVKAADFTAEAYLAIRERASKRLPLHPDHDFQPRCQWCGSLPVGSWPIVDPESGEVLIDTDGRRPRHQRCVWA